MRGQVLVLAVLLGVITAACSSGSGTSAVDSTTTAPTSVVSTTAPSSLASTTTTEIAATTTTEAPTASVAAYTVTSNVLYMTIDGVDLKLDVYATTSDGPSPVVVSFHGLSPRQKGDPDTVAVAREAATQGMIVFVPSWFPGDPAPISAQKLQVTIGLASCAVAFAQQNAADYGGDGTTTVVDGFSAGVFPAMLAALQPVAEPISGCETDAVPTPIQGVVLGDGEYFLYSRPHDGAFEGDPAGMQAELARWLDAANWPPDMDTEFFLWVAGNGTTPRDIDDPADESGWFALRDPDGSIRADLDRLDQLEDGTITYIDAGKLLELRLSAGGVTVTLDEYPGNHTTLDKVAEIVAYFEAAAAQ